MDKDWIKAVTLLCIIAQNNADSMKRSVRYAEIMKKEYGLDAEKFQRIYDSWFCSGEIQEKYRIKDSVTGREQKLPLYHKGVDGMCRMLKEGIIDEKEFFEIFWETPYETLKENEKYTGFNPSLPGCIASAEGKNQLKEELPEDEAGLIAFQFVNAQQNLESSKMVDIMKLVKEITNIVKYQMGLDFDEESV